MSTTEQPNKPLMKWSTPREVEIVDCKYTNQRADGSQMLTSKGDPFWKVNIQIPGKPGVWIQGLVFRDPADWKGSKKLLSFGLVEYRGEQQPSFRQQEPKAARAPRSAVLQTELLTEVRDLLKQILAEMQMQRSL